MTTEYPTPLSIVGAAYCHGFVDSAGRVDCPLSTISTTLGCSDEDVWHLLLPLMKLAKSSIETNDKGDLILSVFAKVPAARQATARPAPNPPAQDALPGVHKVSAFQALGEENERRVLDAIADLEKNSMNVVSRTDLAKLARVKRGSLHGILTRLISRNAIRETADAYGKFRYEIV